MKQFIPVITFLVIMLGMGAKAEDLMTVYGDANTKPGRCVIRGRGHAQGKENIYSGDVINGIYGRGYDGTSFQTSNGAAIELQASQDWSTTAHGTKIVFIATPDDSTTPATVWTIDGDGNLTYTGNYTITATTITLTAPVVASGAFYPYSRTEAQLKVSTPTAVGGVWYDSTNKEFVQSTGTSTCFDYGKIEDATAAPDGW